MNFTYHYVKTCESLLSAMVNNILSILNSTEFEMSVKFVHVTFYFNTNYYTCAKKQCDILKGYSTFFGNRLILPLPQS